MKFLLVISHLLALGTGYLLMPGSDSENTTHTNKEPRTRTRARSLPSTENPFFHASSGDYKALFREVINSPEPRGPLDRLLVVWAKHDPEAALLTFSEYYNPTNSHTVLSGLQNETGSLLAPHLVKHYGKFKHIKSATVEQVLGRSIGVLATEDMNAALRLLEELPKASPETLYSAIIGELNGPQILKLINQIPLSPAVLTMAESSQFWEHSIDRIWRQLPPDQFSRLYHQLDHPLAIKRLTWKSLQEVHRFNDHDAFVDHLTSLPEEKQTLAINTIKGSISYNNYLLNSPLFLEAIQDHNAAELLERLKSPDK